MVTVAILLHQQYNFISPTFPTNDIILTTNIFIIFLNANFTIDQDNKVIEVLKRVHGTESKLVPNRSIKISFY